MDTLKKLKFEANGIIGVLLDYSREPVLTNIIDQFRTSLESNDIELIRYSLEQLKTWYARNRNEIYKNEFVFNEFEHHETENKIKKIFR